MPTPSLRWRFEQALALPAADRRSFLRKACRNDEALYAEVLAMLTMDGDDHALSIERLVVSAESASETDPLMGAVIGAWRVMEMIGRGGAGLVYLAERADGQYEQRAALKLVGPGPRTPCPLHARDVAIWCVTTFWRGGRRHDCGPLAPAMSIHS